MLALSQKPTRKMNSNNSFYVTFIEQLLYAKHCARYLAYIILTRDLMRKMLITDKNAEI